MMPTARFPKPDAVAAGFVASPPRHHAESFASLRFARATSRERWIGKISVKPAVSATSHLCLLWRDHEHELLVTCLDGHRGPYEQADDRGVDERAVAEINEYVGVSGGLFERRTKLRHGAEVVFAVHAHDGKPRLVMADLHGARLRPIAWRGVLRLGVGRH